MRVLERGTMPDGTRILIEDWSEDYGFIPHGGTLASYPKSRVSHKGPLAPKVNKEYRFSFDFKSADEAKNAFKDLLSGAKTLANFKSYLSPDSKEYADCI